MYVLQSRGGDSIRIDIDMSSATPDEVIALINWMENRKMTDEEVDLIWSMLEES